MKHLQKCLLIFWRCTMKKLIKGICSVMMGISAVGVNAQEVPPPYVLTQSIHNVPLDKATCIELIRSHTQSSEQDSKHSQQLSSEIDALKKVLDDLTVQINRLKEEIATMESGEGEGSKAYATSQLELAIEEAYHRMTNEDSTFAQLSTEEQTQIIQSDTTVAEWRTYSDELQKVINEKSALLQQKELDHQHVQYEIDNQTSKLEREKSAQIQLNQCLLYPYSMKPYPAEHLIVNSQSSNLELLLVELDTHMQRLVPTAYQKVSFADIYHLYDIHRSETEVHSQLEGKQEIRLDDLGRTYYSYARELNLLDIEILANLSLRQYFKNGDLSLHQHNYQDVLAIKEEQFNYFYRINQEAFEKIQALLAEYLNANNLVSDNIIAQIRQFHERYQVKLVLFNDQTKVWQPTHSGSGFYSEMMEQPPSATTELMPAITATQPRTSRASALLSSLREKEQSHSEDKSSTSKDESTSSDKLKALKDKLARQNSQSKASSNSSKQKNSADESPSSSKMSTSNSGSEVESKDTGKGVSLPSTGEQRIYFWVAIALLVCGLSFLGIDVYLRLKKKKELENIHLD